MTLVILAWLWNLHELSPMTSAWHDMTGLFLTARHMRDHRSSHCILLKLNLYMVDLSLKARRRREAAARTGTWR